MGFKNPKRRLIVLTAFLFWAMTGLSAQQQAEQADSLVRLMSAKYVRQQEIGDDVVRTAVDAVFLHNGTYLMCDSSVWSANRQVINFMGNVKMLQGDTELTSEKLDYFINEDLAQFRGVLVQLRNKQDNILRTKILDYNTKDSLGVFKGGASMKSEDGQIIESDEGSYSNALNLFTFTGNVNMFADSVFVKTSALDYDSDNEKAIFTKPIDFWKDDNVLTAEGGWYEKPDELFFFEKNVHGISPDQEFWSDSLFFYRNTNDVRMHSNVQLQDTTRSTVGVSDFFLYEDKLSRVTMKKRAAMAMWSESEGQIDTTYFGADFFELHTERRCDVDSTEVAEAASRLETISADPIAEYRKRVAEEYARSRENPDEENNGMGAASSRMQTAEQLAPETEEEKEEKEETEEIEEEALKALPLEQEVEEPKDTSRVGFLKGLGNVKIFREDMQVRCDSMLFNELDSIARFYLDPVIWNEGRRQYSADSLFVLVKNEGADRASLMSNAFIAVQEDSTHFDQIMSTEVLAYFNSDMELRRFDALGGTTALFYIQENDVIATANKVETKLMSANLKDGEVEKVFYFDAPKNDVYPVVQLPAKEQRFKGFNWRPELRPSSPLDITDLQIRPSGRKELQAHERPVFSQTDRFFPGWMEDVYKSIEEARERKRRQARESEAEQQAQDSLAAPAVPDTLALRDSLRLTESLAVGDSLAVADSLAADTEEQWMSERELRRAMRIARRDARWAELDARDAKKAELKKQKREEKLRRKEERAARRKARQEAKDQEKLQKYIEYFEKQKQQNERKQELEPARERASGIEIGGELSAPFELER